MFIKYKLKWIGDYGYGPEAKAIELGHEIIPTWIETSENEILSYATDGLDPENFVEYELEILTNQEAIDMAMSVDEFSYLDDNDQLLSSRPPIFFENDEIESIAGA